MPMHYACPHLPTCSEVNYNKKPCDKHSCLSITRVQAHTLNQKIHGNCTPACPVYKISTRSIKNFTFQPFNPSPLNSERETNETIEVQGTDSVVHSRHTNKEKETHSGLGLDKVNQSGLLISIRVVLRFIAYGLLVGTWSESCFSLKMNSPHPNFEYMCDFACVYFRSALQFIIHLKAPEEFCFTAVQLCLCGVFVL
ncbi:hypothetical protein MJO28_002032 [Puccinia striiformis f. sp. tritici]|uniref:Uncharacterized protein n=3 Tax=Puccinia striiformis TaxID=27350 RepID=A0A2S4V5V9_9BASI|nr:hypothetical protein MJO28_002032 [Puccinia striiformis f. sp. tritici]POV99939.1 hypothetical protein PSHT_13319 [Puccinia striiformis]POW04877.1 hypothetical protein PSTT_10110 [Puccinia striiformis]